MVVQMPANATSTPDGPVKPEDVAAAADAAADADADETALTSLPSDGTPMPETGTVAMDHSPFRPQIDTDEVDEALAKYHAELAANPNAVYPECDEATEAAVAPEGEICKSQYETAFAHTTENDPDTVHAIASSDKADVPMLPELGNPVGTPTAAPAARIETVMKQVVNQTGSSRVGDMVAATTTCISAAVCGLSRDKVKTIDNRTAEYDGRIDEIEKNGARMVAFEDADDFEKAMQLEEQDNADAVEINDDILADIDDIAENAEHDSTNLSGGLRDTLAPARTAVAEASERLDGESASFQADLDRLYQNRTSIEVEITQQTDAMSVEEADFAKFENTADSRRSEIMKGITGLEACLAADLKVRADTTERTNNHNRSLKVHACKMTTLEQLHRICNDQIARHEEALAVIAANLRGCALASELLDEVEKWCVAGYEARRDAPADAAEIVASADYRRQLMTRSITLLNTAIIRRYNIVKAAANKVAISKARITRTKQQEAAAFKFRNRAKVVELKRLREGEYSEELVTDEADHAKHLVDFETFVEQTRYAVTRKQLISDFDETDDSIGKDALEVVAEMPTTDEHIINGEGQLALMMLQ
mmetsp:Transcript_21559/g.56202  ORF Transcript_21559/g.56202 Transcript_21559/m.56202 type:complete len:596 (-) Transcript_21559:149-1936(-)